MLPGLFFREIYCGITCIGPGRKSATMAIRSKIVVGFSSFIYRRMPADSSWNTPVVSPTASISNVFLSVRGMPYKSITFPFTSSINLRAAAIIVRFRSPRKSIFSSPTPSSPTVYMSYCVTTRSPLLSLCSGVYSTSGLSAITTPAACTEA